MDRKEVNIKGTYILQGFVNAMYTDGEDNRKHILIGLFTLLRPNVYPPPRKPVITIL